MIVGTFEDPVLNDDTKWTLSGDAEIHINGSRPEGGDKGLVLNGVSTSCKARNNTGVTVAGSLDYAFIFWFKRVGEPIDPETDSVALKVAFFDENGLSLGESIVNEANTDWTPVSVPFRTGESSELFVELSLNNANTNNKGYFIDDIMITGAPETAKVYQTTRPVNYSGPANKIGMPDTSVPAETVISVTLNRDGSVPASIQALVDSGDLQEV